MPPKIVNSQPDPRIPIAMNMMADLFLRSITRFSPLSKLPKLTALDEKLKQRALQAIQAKSPQDRKISVTRVSQLGPGNLWKGLDLAPQRISKSPGNQQRLQNSVNQTPLNPQQRKNQTMQVNSKVQAKPEIQINQNLPKRPIQRNHNRAAENDLNDSRKIGQMKEVTGNMVSQNLMRNQKSVRDDFGITDKSSDKKRKYSNQNDKSSNVKSGMKTNARNMTESRALNENREKRVSFSPEKPLEHSIDKKQVSQTKKLNDTKPTAVVASKTINIKQQKSQPYVYVPPTKRVVINEAEKTEQHESLKIQPVQTKNIPEKNPPNLSKEQQKKPVQSTIVPATTNNPQIKIKSRQEILAQQQKSRKTTVVSPPIATSPSYVYQPSQKPTSKPQTSSKKVGFNLSENKQKKAETSIEIQKSALKPTSHRVIATDQNIEIKKNIVTAKNPQNSNPQKTNVSLQLQAKSKIPQTQQTSYRVGQRKKTDVSVEEMRNDWSKIKENLKYDRSYSPEQRKNKIPERQDVALKMIAQLFLDASTRYFPGLSMLLKRGISKEDIDKFRSKSSEFNINITTVDRRSISKPQPKTDRKLNWRQNSENAIGIDKKNNRIFQGDVTATQYKVKKTEQVVIENPSVINKTPVQQVQKSLNIVSQSLQINNKRMTRDDSTLDKQKKEPSQRSNSIRQSPDVYKRETSRKDLEDSKKNIEKLKKEVSKLPETNKSQQEKPPVTAVKPVQLKQEIKEPVKIQTNNITFPKKSQESTYVYQPPAKRQPETTKTQVQTILKPEKPQTAQILKQVATQIIKTANQDKINAQSGNNTSKISQTKPTPKPVNIKSEPDGKKPIVNNNTAKNVSILSSKSQTSLTEQTSKTPVQSIKPQQSATQTPKANQSRATQKNDNSQTLRNVKSQNALKTFDQNEKSQNTTMLKKQQKILILEPPKIKDSETKESKPQSKKFSMIIFFVLKKRLSSNLAFSFQKIQSKARKQSELINHASFLSRSLTNFTQHYQKILLRNAFNKIRSNIVLTVNKVVKQSKAVEENRNFSSGRKQSASRVIFLLLNSKVSSFFQPLTKIYLQISNKSKIKENVIQVMAKIFEKRFLINKKAGFKAIKGRKNQRQAVLSVFANTLQRIHYNAISQNFANLINKDIKQLAAKVKTIKPLSFNQFGLNHPSSNEAQKTLQKSKSQEVFTSIKVEKEENLNAEKTSKYSPAEEAKLQSKRKQIQRKINDLQNKKQSLQQETNNLNKEKRQKLKNNSDLKTKLKEVQKQLQNQQTTSGSHSQIQKPKQKESSLTEGDLIPILTRIYAYLFEDPDNTQIMIERFLSDNQHCFQLPTNAGLMNEWKIIKKNAELKRDIKIYEGEQPREKRITEVLQEENLLMGRLLRSFVRERYIWEWVNIIAHE